MDVTPNQQDGPGKPTLAWCRDPALAPAVARLFVEHADAAYISHSELQFGRADAPGRWSEDLEAKVAAEATQAIARTIADEASGTRLAVLRDGDRIDGVAFVTFVPEARIPFATLEDLLIVPAARGHGAGRLALDWVASECRARGCRRLFLESGLGNDRAHHFFETQGFAQTSIVMMRDL